MTVRAAGSGTLVLDGNCPASDAEALLGLLLAHPGAVVDCRGCTHAHGTVIQVLLAAHAKLRGPPRCAVLQHVFAVQFNA